MSFTPPTWSRCQWVRITESRVAFSEERVFLMLEIQEGCPSPVSIKMRVGPEPTRYVFVPYHLADPLQELSG